MNSQINPQLMDIPDHTQMHAHTQATHVSYTLAYLSLSFKSFSSSFNIPTSLHM